MPTPSLLPYSRRGVFIRLEEIQEHVCYVLSLGIYSQSFSLFLSLSLSCSLSIQWGLKGKHEAPPCSGSLRMGDWVDFATSSSKEKFLPPCPLPFICFPCACGQVLRSWRPRFGFGISVVGLWSACKRMQRSSSLYSPLTLEEAIWGCGQRPVVRNKVTELHWDALLIPPGI